MRRCRKRITSQVRNGLCGFCTNTGLTFLNSPYPQHLVGMLLALVQKLFRARVSREFASISIGGTIRLCGKGLFRRSVTVCALFAQTQGLHF